MEILLESSGSGLDVSRGVLLSGQAQTCSWKIIGSSAALDIVGITRLKNTDFQLQLVYQP